jgi:hypothetical protein
MTEVRKKNLRIVGNFRIERKMGKIKIKKTLANGITKVEVIWRPLS